jgi:class 3 adenylate cyclase
VHAAEATRRGQDYSGGEVHKAARIAALAQGGEILATVDTEADAMGDLRVSEPRQVTLKGISEPVQVVRIEWR